MHSVRKAGEKWPGSGIPKVAGSGRSRGKIMQHNCNLCNILQSQKQKGQEPGLTL